MITVMCGYIMPAIWTQTRTATSSPRHAVDGVSMEVPAGEVATGGVPTGAGTTTTIRPGQLSSRTAYPTEDQTMSSLPRPATPFAPLTAQRVDARRLLWVAPLTVLAALLANSIVQSLAHSLFPVTRAFSHLMVGAVALTTVGAVGAACLVFAVVARQARRPIWLYRRVAVVALVVTLILDVVLVLFTPSDPSYSTAGIVSLMVMHVVDAASYVGLLTTVPRIGTARGGPGRDEWVSTQGGA